jgi:hypothetical protein
LKECIRCIDQSCLHAPFRQSKLTRVLRDCFIGCGRTILIATVSPTDDCVSCSLNTLQYANRVRQMALRNNNRNENVINKRVLNNYTHARQSINNSGQTRTEFFNNNNKKEEKLRRIQQNLAISVKAYSLSVKNKNLNHQTNYAEENKKNSIKKRLTSTSSTSSLNTNTNNKLSHPQKVIKRQNSLSHRATTTSSTSSSTNSISNASMTSINNKNIIKKPAFNNLNENEKLKATHSTPPQFSSTSSSSAVTNSDIITKVRKISHRSAESINRNELKTSPKHMNTKFTTKSNKIESNLKRVIVNNNAASFHPSKINMSSTPIKGMLNKNDENTSFSKSPSRQTTEKSILVLTNT